MGRRKRPNDVGDKATELGYRLQREHVFWGNFWLWSRAQDFPISVTPDLEVIDSFLDQPEDFCAHFKEVQRVEWNRMTRERFPRYRR